MREGGVVGFTHPTPYLDPAFAIAIATKRSTRYLESMQIGLNHEQILEYSKRFAFVGDEVLTARLQKAVDRGHMIRDDLIEVAKWKWRGGRTRQLCGENTEAEVCEISKVSFAAKCERLRIGVLLALSGVQWPMASVILHFSYPDSYPIWDVRVMKSVGGTTGYTFESWIQYVDLCRKTAIEHNISLRTLDKALWAHDKNS